MAKKKTAAGKTEQDNNKNNKIKILYATSECVPFANSGGLGEVAGSLPRALNRKRDIECRVIMPLYGAVSDEFREKMRFLGSCEVGVTWRMQYMGLFELRYKGVTYCIPTDIDGLRMYCNKKMFDEAVPLINKFLKGEK